VSATHQPAPRGAAQRRTRVAAAFTLRPTVILGSVKICDGFCLSDSGPITGGSYTDAALSVQGSIPAGGYYFVSPCYCTTPQTDITAWSIAMYAGPVRFSGSFISATTLVGTVYFSSGAAADSVAITMVKQ
jgi:hypothetical protein